MISYSTNWMGPINEDWIKKYGEGWSAGRMDIRGVPGNEYWNGWHEYSLPPMQTEDWNDFSDWLDDFETEELMSLEDILEEYRQDTGHVIRWCKEDE